MSFFSYLYVMLLSFGQPMVVDQVDLPSDPVACSQDAPSFWFLFAPESDSKDQGISNGF
ncbi:MAG: hypothetical protein JXX28_03895 [Deltaproteobacteria bacterium]|nr:hypothetical protein [Deltaproteobacteria bacterium]